MTSIWTIPTQLTCLRILAAVCIPICFLVLPHSTSVILATSLYFFAAITDFLDGWLARKLDQVTPLGRMLDPIADKIMVVMTLFTLASLKEWHTWVFIVPAIAILVREVFISGLREFLAGAVTLHVTWAAKLKTSVQLISLGVLLASLFNSGAQGILETAGMTLLWFAAILSVKTGYDYVRAAKQSYL